MRTGPLSDSTMMAVRHHFPSILMGWVILSSLFVRWAQAEPDLDRLSPDEIAVVDSILEKLAPMIEEKKLAGDLPTLTYEELYHPLTEPEREFLKDLQSIPPERLGVKTPYLGIADGSTALIRLDRQRIRKGGKEIYIDTQYVPHDVFQRYGEMMKAMEQDLGKRLYVASGFRSPAYQLYLFLFYLPKHRYSIRETGQWSALPGYSEHGWPGRQALDFVNEEGVDGEEGPRTFEVLEEYRWLLRHAEKYHFALSYPKDNPLGMGFEPWHWHYDGNDSPHETSQPARTEV